MRNRSWKAAETRLARDVGTERKPCDGSRDGADFADGLCCYQLKVRKMLPAWLWRWLLGIVATARKDRKIGALVLKTPRMRDTEALVILRWSDWISLHGIPKPPPDRCRDCGEPIDHEGEVRLCSDCYV